MPDSWWNPNPDDFAGLEGSAILSGHDTLSAGGRGEYQRFLSATGGVQNGVSIHSRATRSAGRIGVELFSVGSEIAGAVTTTRFVPITCSIAGGISLDEDAVGTPGPASVNTTALNKWIAMAANDAASPRNPVLRARFDTSAVSGRILGISIRVIAAEGMLHPTTGGWYPGAAGRSLTCNLTDAAATTSLEYMGQIPIGYSWNNGAPLGTVTQSPVLQAFNTQFWNNALLADLDSGGLMQITLAPSGPLPDKAYMTIFYVELAVYSCPENRLAAGVIFPLVPVATPTWLAGTLFAPDQVSSYTKQFGNITVVSRPLITPFISTTGYPDLDWSHTESADPISLDVADTTKQGAGPAYIDQYGRITGMGDPNPRKMRAFALTATSVPHDDSQPYVGALDTTPYVSIGVAQSFPGTAGKTPSHVRVILRKAHYRDPTIPEPTKQVLVDIRRESDNVVMASGYFDPVVDFEDPIMSRELFNGYREIFVPLHTTTALAAVAYRAQLVSLESEFLWDHPAIVTSLTNSPTNVYVETWGGNTYQYGVFPPLTYDNRYDGYITPMYPPPPPTGLTVVQAWQATNNLDAYGRPIEIPYAKLTWTPPTLPSVTGHYQLARKDSITDRWDLIRQISAPDTLADTANDYEAAIGLLSQWKIRYRKASGAFSAWSNTVSLSLTGGPALSLTSNERPDLNLGFDDISGESPASREYADLDIESTTLQPLYNQDGFDILRNTEERGERFQRELWVRRSNSQGGWRDFRPIKDLARISTYTCLREFGGNRSFTNMNLVSRKSTPWTEPDAFQRAIVEFTTVQFRPGLVVT